MTHLKRKRQFGGFSNSVNWPSCSSGIRPSVTGYLFTTFGTNAVPFICGSLAVRFHSWHISVKSISSYFVHIFVRHTRHLRWYIDKAAASEFGCQPSFPRHPHFCLTNACLRVKLSSKYNRHVWDLPFHIALQPVVENIVHSVCSYRHFTQHYSDQYKKHSFIYIYIYIYIHTHTHTHTEGAKKYIHIYIYT